MSDFSAYVDFPSDEWEHEPSDCSVGIMSDSMVHLPCLTSSNCGSADLTGGSSETVRLPNGYERFSEEWTCLDCGRAQTFVLDAYTGWDEPDGSVNSTRLAVSL